MKIKELREKTENELQSLLKESREKLRQIKFDLKSRQSKNPQEINQTKKVIARILTILSTLRSSDAIAPGLRSRSDCYGGVGEDGR